MSGADFFDSDPRKDFVHKQFAQLRESAFDREFRRPVTSLIKTAFEMCCCKRATVRDVAARELISALAVHLAKESVIRIPVNMGTNNDLARFYFEEAASLMRGYYVTPSILVPRAVKRAANGEREMAEAVKASVRRCAYSEFIRVGWLKRDERSKLVLVTDDAKREMDNIAANVKLNVDL